MSIKKIFKDGMAEHKRKSSLRSSKRNLVEKEKAYEVKLTALGKKARDAKLDISQFGDLSGTLSQIEGKGKEIGAKLDELNKQTAELGGKKKAENSRFDALWKDLETKKKPVDSELRSEKDKLEKAQKEAESIQKRLKNIPDEEEKIRKKITESQGNTQAQAELEKKLTALKEEQKQLDPKLPDLTRFIQAAKEKITPLDQQSGRLEAEMKKAKDQHKKEIEDIDKTLSKVKGEINEFNKQQKAVSGQQVQNFQALGKKLSEANYPDPAIAAELEAVKAAEKEMGSLREGIQSLESQKAPGARGAVWKMVGLVLLFLVIIAAIAVGIVFLTKHKAGKKGGSGKAETQLTQVDKGKSPDLNKTQQKENGGDSQPVAAARQERFLTQVELNQMADGKDRYFQTLEREIQEIPRDTFDPQAIVDKVGKDPKALFDWVRDHTYLVFYQGVLRGPIGVLLDSNCNSLDRALLLRELLRLAGYKARLARGILSEEMAVEVLKKIRPISNKSELNRTSFSCQEMENIQKEYTRKYQLGEEKIWEAMNNSAKENEEIIKRFNERVAEQTEYIYSAVKGCQTKSDAMAANDTFRSLQDHWWTQIRNGNDWQDMDPTAVDSTPGKKLVEETETLEPENISEDMFHFVKIRIITEQWANGKFTENTALEQILKPSELLDKPLRISHIPMNWPKDMIRWDASDFIVKLNNTLLSKSEWQPVLIVGSEIVAQSSFTDSGDINKSPGKKAGPSGVSGITGGLFRAIAGEESEKSKEEQKAISYLTSEWIEFEIHSPGRSLQIIRRPVFDLVGPSARNKERYAVSGLNDKQRVERALSLLGDKEILLQVSYLSPEFVGYLMGKGLFANRDILLNWIRKNRLDKEDNIASWLKKIIPLPGPEFSLALARQLWNQFSNNTFIGSPNILCFFRDFRSNAEGKIVGHSGFDILSNDVSVCQKSGSYPFQTILRQGVVDSNAEAFIMKERNELGQSASELLAIDRLRRNEWVLIKNSRDSVWRQVEASNDVRARIEEGLKNGFVVLAPRKPIFLDKKSYFAWWEIDPATGRTLGITEFGQGGQPLTEYQLAVGIMLSGNYILWKFMYNCGDKKTRTERIDCVSDTAICTIINGAIVFVGWMSIWVKFLQNYAVTLFAVCFGISLIC